MQSYYNLPLYFSFFFNYFFTMYVDETLAMRFQPNLASRPKVVSIYKCPKTFGAFPQIWGAKNQIMDNFSRDFRTRHRISSEWNVASTNKDASVNLQCVPTSWPTLHDLWPRNGWDPLAHCDPPYKNSAFPSLLGFPHKGHWTHANQILA